MGTGVWLAGIVCLVSGFAAFGPASAAGEKSSVQQTADLYAEMQSKGHVQAWQRYPFVGIPLVAKGPAIDGVVDKREWMAAAAIPYVLEFSSGMKVRNPVRFLICYTDTHLYFAFQFWRPENARKPDEKDFFEFLMDVDHGHKKYCNLAGNVEKVLWTGIGPRVDKKAWVPPCEYKARETDFGWEGEVKIAFKDVPGYQAAPKPGTIWGADFVRNEKTPSDRVANWAWRLGWHSVKDLGHLMFTGQPVAIQVESIGWDPVKKKTGVRLNVVNFSNAPVSLKSFLELRRAKENLVMEYYRALDSAMQEEMEAAVGAKLENEIKNALLKYEVQKEISGEVQVPPMGSKIVEMAEAAEPGNYLMAFSIQSAQQALVGMVVPFVVSVPLEVKLSSYLYSARTLAYEVDLRDVQGRILKESRLVMRARLGKDGKEVAMREHPEIYGKESLDGELVFDPVPASTYFVTASIMAGDKVVVQNELPLQIPPKAEWIGNNIGRKKFVPKPWIPLKADAAGCETLTVKYRWSPGSFFPSMTVCEKELLARPIEMKFRRADGQGGAVKMKSFTLKESDIEQAVYAFEGEVEGAGKLCGTVRVEFDGFLWYDLTFTPNGNPEMGWCSLDVRIKPKYSRLFARGRLDTWYDVKPEGEECGRLPPDGLNLPFVFQVWLGDEEGGLQWYAENRRDWFNEFSGKAIQIRPEDAGTLLSIHFIDKKTKVEHPLRWAFGFSPTPSRTQYKPLEDHAYLQVHGIPSMDPPNASLQKENPGQYAKAKKHYELFQGEITAKGVKAVILFSAWNAEEFMGYPGTKNPETAKKLKEFIKAMHAQGIKVLVYAGWGFSIKAPEWKDYGWEMVKQPLRNSGYDTYWACPVGLFPDLYVYRLAEMIRLYDLDGVYMDSTGEICYSLNYNGMRWTNANGEVQGSFYVLAMRDFFKRIYKVLHGEVKEDGFFYNHHSTMADVCVENFTDLRCPSEFAQFYNGELTEEFVDFFIVKNGGSPFGYHTELTNKNWMKGITYQVNQLMGIMLPLNVSYKSVGFGFPEDYSPTAQPMSKIWKAWAWLESAKAEHLPWWKNEPFVTTVPAANPKNQVLTGLWLRRGEKAVLCVSNLKKEPRNIEVTLNLGNLGLNAVQAEDAITGEVVEVNGNKISLPVDSERWRLLKISPK